MHRNLRTMVTLVTLYGNFKLEFCTVRENEKLRALEILWQVKGFFEYGFSPPATAIALAVAM